MKENRIWWILFLIWGLFFFSKVGIKKLLPIPADALVGLYHPYRDYYAKENPQGVAYKNYLLTDPVLQQYPWKWLAIQQWRQGNVPGENPYNFSGTSLSGNIQAGVYYPLNALLLSSSFDLSWSVFIMVQPLLAAAMMIFWLKNRGFSPIPQLFGGIVWAFSSFNLVWLEWGNMGHAGLYLPLALLAVDKLKVKSQKLKVSWKWHGLLQISLILSLLAGHWQVTLYLILAVGLYSLLNRKLLLFSTHLLLLIGLTFFQWQPALKTVLASNRSVEQSDVLTREGFFIRPRQLAQIVAPDLFGNPATLNYWGVWNYAEQVIYIGLVPLLLVVARLASRKNGGLKKDRGLVIFALILVAGGLIMMVKNPIAKLPYRFKIPILSGLQPTRLSYLVTFGASILAVLGMSELVNNPGRMLKRLLTTALEVGGILFIILIMTGKLEFNEKIVSQRNLILPTILTFMTMVVVWLTWGLGAKGKRFGKRAGVIAGIFLLTITVFDLFRFGWKFTPFSSREYVYPVTPAIKFLQNNMKESDRYMTVDRRILPPNANIMYGLKTIEGYDPVYSRDYALLVTRMENGEEQNDPVSFGRIVRPDNYQSPMVRQLGVKYVLALSDLEDLSLEKVFQEGQTRIYQLK